MSNMDNYVYYGANTEEVRQLSTIMEDRWKDDFYYARSRREIPKRQLSRLNPYSEIENDKNLQSIRSAKFSKAITYATQLKNQATMRKKDLLHTIEQDKIQYPYGYATLNTAAAKLYTGAYGPVRFSNILYADCSEPLWKYYENMKNPMERNSLYGESIETDNDFMNTLYSCNARTIFLNYYPWVMLERECLTSIDIHRVEEYSFLKSFKEHLQKYNELDLHEVVKANQSFKEEHPREWAMTQRYYTDLLQKSQKDRTMFFIAAGFQTPQEIPVDFYISPFKYLPEIERWNESYLQYIFETPAFISGMSYHERPSVEGLKNLCCNRSDALKTVHQELIRRTSKNFDIPFEEFQKISMSNDSNDKFSSYVEFVKEPYAAYNHPFRECAGWSFSQKHFEYAFNNQYITSEDISKNMDAEQIIEHHKRKEIVNLYNTMLANMRHESPQTWDEIPERLQRATDFKYYGTWYQHHMNYKQWQEKMEKKEREEEDNQHKKSSSWSGLRNKIRRTT